MFQHRLSVTTMHREDHIIAVCTLNACNMITVWINWINLLSMCTLYYHLVLGGTICKDTDMTLEIGPQAPACVIIGFFLASEAVEYQPFHGQSFCNVSNCLMCSGSSVCVPP